jgi:hypothetical protein
MHFDNFLPRDFIEVLFSKAWQQVNFEHADICVPTAFITFDVGQVLLFNEACKSGHMPKLRFDFAGVFTVAYAVERQAAFLARLFQS